MAHADDKENLDALVRRVDPDRWLSSRFVSDPQVRADLVAIYAYDHELARAPRIGSNPLTGEMRLVWWREVLDEIFQGRPVRRHPTAQALDAAVRRRGLSRDGLERMIDARYRELDPTPMEKAEALDWAKETAGEAAALAAHVLEPDGEAEPARWAGAAWALAHALAAGRLAPEAGPGTVAEALRRARAETKFLSARAFPAVAHAALAQGRTAGRGSELARRLRLTWAVARGRI